ncbi:M24 family metallopeptidase [Streptomyces sp. HUAS TT7]|uniref:M24 family metallopeptidase n=1 Tax=Streptomyces sp. HUAS TT7 TaxID=3447507 RepID=UPI003F65F3C6
MAVPDRMDERLRALGLVEGQRMAEALFAEVAARGLIAPGFSERELSDLIDDLARSMSRSVAGRPRPRVRSGPHSLLPCGQEPPADRVIGEDDLVVVDLGPAPSGYGTAFARTVAVGGDPDKRRLAEDLRMIFEAGREAFHAQRTLTARQLYGEVQTLAAKAGWALGGRHVGHLAAATPAARDDAYIGPDNDRPLRRTTEGGWQAHWVLEIHLVDEHRGHGGSFKGLLDLA